MINYERNSRRVILKRSYPKFIDHGLSGRPVLREAGSLVVVPARGQNPQLWSLSGRGQNRPGQKSFNRIVIMPFGLRPTPRTLKFLQKNQKISMCTMKMLVCVQTMIERHVLCPRGFNETLALLGSRRCR